MSLLYYACNIRATRGLGLNPERIMQALLVLESQKRGKDRTLRPVYDYSMPNVSDKVVKIIISYTDYIKRTVWSE